MTAHLANLVRVTTATTGTGTITLGAAVAGARTFAQASIPDGATVSYGIADGAASEVGRGVYDAAAGTLTRGPVASTAGGAAISLSGSAEVFVAALAEDFADRATAAQGALAATAVQPGDLSAVATSGAYSDLTGRPTIPTTPGEVGAAAASHTHVLADISDAGTAAAAAVGDFATAAQGALADTAVQPGDLATVATSGAYSDLSGRPTLGTAAATDAADYATAAQGAAADTAVQPGDLATVATSGAYTDLSGRPTLGTAAAQDVGAFATAAQGALADSSVQPADLVAASRVLWVDPAGDDTAAGDLPTAPLKTITAALAAATAGTCIRVRAGIYTEAAPMVVPRDVSLVGDGLRVTEVRPTAGTANQTLFLVDSGCYFWGITFARHQAGSWAVAFNSAADNTALGATGLGAFIFKSPYIQNCSSYTAQDDAGLAGSTSDGTTGGGMLVDGAACAPNSPIRSMVVDSFTQVNLDGPGCLVTNDGYAQLVSFFGTFCSYHVKATAGGQVNLSNSTTNFGTYGLIADGRSTTPLFSGTGAAAADGANQIDVTAMTSNRLGGSSRPALGQVFDVGGTQRTATGASPISGGWRVTFYPALTAAFAGGAVEFFQRSQIMTGGQNMEFVGAGTNYLALPWNGGVPIQANEIVEANGGRVFYSTTDHLGTFRVGPQFSVDGTTGEVTINTDSFNVSGLNQIGPFKREGGQTTVGVQLREVSNDAGLISSTGAADGNTVPTQAAVVAYVAATSAPRTRTVTAGTGLTGGGDLSADRTLSLSTASLASLALADTAVQPGDLGTAAALDVAAAGDASATQVVLGSDTRLTDARAPTAHTHGLADITDAGTAAAAAVADFATAAQGALADTAVQPADLGTAAGLDAPAAGDAAAGEVVLGSDTRLTDARAPTAHTHPASDVTGLATVATSGAYSDLSGVPATFAPSAHKANHATGGSDALAPADIGAEVAGAAAAEVSAHVGAADPHGQYALETSLAAVATSGAYIDLSGRPTLGTAAPLDVAAAGDAAAGQVVKGDDTRLSDARTPTAHTHPASDVTGLATVATSGAYTDLSGRPTLGTAAALDVGTGANAVVQLDATGKLPAVDGSQLTNIGAATGVGDVVGPAGATDGHAVVFDGTTGKLVKSGGGALGSAAFTASTDYATAAQGGLADSAVQPGDLATVATTGAYADLSGTPTIPQNANDLATEGVALGNISGSATLDCTAGQVFTGTVTGAVTLTFSNPETYDEIVLHLTNGGSAAVTWPASVDWPGGSAPALTAAGVDVLVFVTADGGTTWRGAMAAEDVK